MNDQQIEGRIRYILDTRHTVPLGQSHTDTYTRPIVDFVKIVRDDAEVRENNNLINAILYIPGLTEYQKREIAGFQLAKRVAVTSTFTGEVSEVKTYDHALTTEEVADIFQEGKSDET